MGVSGPLSLKLVDPNSRNSATDIIAANRYQEGMWLPSPSGICLTRLIAP